MSTHVSLNLLNNLRKNYKMRGFTKQFNLFLNRFNKFDNTRAQI